MSGTSGKKRYRNVLNDEYDNIPRTTKYRMKLKKHSNIIVSNFLIIFIILYKNLKVFN